MTRKFLIILTAFVFSVCNVVKAQFVEVQADYNSIGDCIFTAYNNAEAPLYLEIKFSDLQNTSFTESQPFVKRLIPGFNDLFTLQRDLDADVPDFHYDMKIFRSDPIAKVNLDFPYLIPFQPGEKIYSIDVKSLNGFWGNKEPESWSATGFVANAGEAVFASRSGVVVEIVGAERLSEPKSWYNTWTNSITLLQADGTLACYHNVVDKSKTLKVGEKVYAGRQIGNIAANANSLTLLFYHESLHSDGLLFVIPQFVIAEDETAIVNSSEEYSVTHPTKVRGLEMTKKERKKILGKK